MDNHANHHISEPHPVFAIILVGPEEHPFGIQKDFLCDRSEFYGKYFAARDMDEKLEHIVRLPDTTKEVFGLAQNFIYTQEVISDVENPPSYESLVGLWKLGHELGIKGLCDKTLDSMVDCRRLTETIPSTPLLVQVWKDTPEGSSIRRLLLSWAAEFMRSSNLRAEFAKSLPQEVLSELVVAMSSFETAPAPQPSVPDFGPVASVTQKNVHYLDDDSGDEALKNLKKNRRSLGTPTGPAPLAGKDHVLIRKQSRPSLSKPVQKRRISSAYADPSSFTMAQKLEFCSDLLSRMLSGPGMALSTNKSHFHKC